MSRSQHQEQLRAKYIRNFERVEALMKDVKLRDEMRAFKSPVDGYIIMKTLLYIVLLRNVLLRSLYLCVMIFIVLCWFISYCTTLYCDV